MKSLFYKRAVLLLCILVYFAGFSWGSFSDTFILENKHVGIHPMINNYLHLRTFDIFIDIMKNNLMVTLFNVCLGIFTIGILSYVFTLYNGFVFGYVFSVACREIGAKEVLASTLPHSMEIVAIIWSCYLGCIISYKLLNEIILEKETIFRWKKIIKQMIFCSLIVIVSAFLESYVSMQ